MSLAPPRGNFRNSRRQGAESTSSMANMYYMTIIKTYIIKTFLIIIRNAGGDVEKAVLFTLTHGQ